jgi:hypothetical protein
VSGTLLDKVLDFIGSAPPPPPREYVRDFIRDIVTKAGPSLVESRNHYRDVGEDGLTSTLLGSLKWTYGSSRETNANGHVDVTLKHPLGAGESCLKGEAKALCPKRFKWYEEGLTKLVGKYNSGHEGIALMLCYCRCGNAFMMMEKYHRQIVSGATAFFVADSTLAEAGLPTDLQGVFVTKHSASGVDILVAHVWLNMYAPTDDEIMEAAQAHARRVGGRKKKTSGT